MKKILLGLVIAATSFSSFAAVVLNEPFSYDDGSLITVSGGGWATHSGSTPGQVDVTSGKVNLTQNDSEDVNAQLSGGPYSDGNLYASFVINFLALPSSGGAYFAHFKDDAFGFRGRVFAQTTGAAAGQFRLAIANSGSPIAIEKDLSLDTDYIVVMRYDTVAATTTVWINPGSESATGDRADATDSIGAVAVSAFGLRQASGIGTLTLDNLKVGTTFADVSSGGNPALNPPIISNILNQNVPANTPTTAIPFTINDGETIGANLVLTKETLNPTLVPVENIVFGGSENDRTVTVTPAAGQQGTTTITVTVTDSDLNTASREFLITVGAPSISSVANQTTPTNTSTAPIAFTISDTESAATSLEMSATSSDEAVVPNANITFGGTGSDRTVILTPTADVAGSTRITLTVSDGINSVSTEFQLTVHPSLGIDFEDDFSYADGSVVIGSGFAWDTHSGLDEQTQVVDGKLLLDGAQTEDINHFLVRAPYETNSGVILYSKFTMNFSALPTAEAYFAHFRDTSSGFRARVYATITDAASGSFRLGLSNGGNTFDQLPMDLNLDTTYTVVTRYNVGTGESALWVNPFSEASPNVTGTDTTFPQWIWTYAFRQASGLGTVAIDDLKVGTAFSEVLDVVALPPTLTIAKIGNDIEISWPTADSSGYVLESKTDVGPGVWSEVLETPVFSGDRNVVTLPNTGSGNRFFRLKQP